MRPGNLFLDRRGCGGALRGEGIGSGVVNVIVFLLMLMTMPVLRALHFWRSDIAVKLGRSRRFWENKGNTFIPLSQKTTCSRHGDECAGKTLWRDVSRWARYYCRRDNPAIRFAKQNWRDNQGTTGMPVGLFSI